MWASYVVIREDMTGQNDPSSRHVRTLTTTNDNHRFTVRLESGFHDVCVMSDGFQPLCRKVKIEDGKSIDERFTLKMDLNVLKGVSHRVPLDGR